MVKVLVYSQLPPPVHGSTVMTQTLIRSLEDLGHEVAILERHFSQSSTDVGTFRIGKLLRIPGLLWRAWIACRARPDVAIFFATNRRGSFMVDCLVLLTLRVFRVKVVHYLHTAGWDGLARGIRPFGALVPRFLAAARVVVCLGGSLSDPIRSIAPNTRIRCIPNALAVPTMTRSASRGESDEIKVAFLSNLLPEKGADHFLEVAALLQKAAPSKYRFLLAGGGEPAYVEQLQSHPSLAGAGTRVSFLGPLDTTQKWGLLDSADILVFPSRYPLEAQPLTIIEAMAFGVPTFGFRIGGLPDCVVEGVSGRLSEPGDVEALARSILELTASEAGLRQLQRDTEAHFRNHFSIHQFAASWGKVLDEFNIRG
jgi:glycosyltransferase involved in cell wall biosynthesis